MRNFACSSCGYEVYFENVKCLRCKSALGFLVDVKAIVALQPAGEGLYRRVGGRDTRLLAYCANSAHEVCNWLVPAADGDNLCSACVLNRTIPNLSEDGSLAAWGELERAKKRLVYSLSRFDLPLDAASSGKGRLAFDFVRNATTGHLDGLITIDIIEADAVERERQRQYFGENYRSLLGHLRHESGHFYWMVLVEAAKRLKQFRALFGDERQDYAQALATHHASGPPTGWQERYVSAYASSHPWEDWAETWALYLHIVDAVDTADAESIEPRAVRRPLSAIWRPKAYDVYREGTFPTLMKRWIPLALAMNSLSRSLGYADFYPFVIPAPAYDKLEYMHGLIRKSLQPKSKERERARETARG